MDKRRSILSLCIAMALSGNSWAADTNDISKNEQQTINCSEDSSTLSAVDKEKFSARCPKDDDSLLEWVAAGVAAVGAAVGIAVYNDDDGGSNHTSADTGPTPPNPDDGGDGGDGGDDGGDPTPPPPDTGSVTYSNGVTLDESAKTVTFDAVTGQSDGPVTFSYVKSGDNYILTAPDGRTLTVTNWKVTADNQLAITGTYGSDSAIWIYDRSGNFTFASADTNTFTGDGTSNTVDGDTTASGSGEAGTIVSGDDTKTDVNGDTAASDGGTGTKVDGDGAEVNNNGNTTVDGDGSTGTAVTGDDAVVNNGDTSTTGGGTGTKVDGDNAQINNNGDATVHGDGSTGTAITGDGAVVNNGGDAKISGGGTGTRVDGNDAVIVNTGDTTADGEGSAGTVINGDNASFDQQGDITVTNGATGIAVNGATAKIDNSGTITVTDAGSTGVLVSGDNASFTNTGTLDSSLNGTGVSITGDSASVMLDGTVNVHAVKDADGIYQGATGVSVAGNNGTAEITGDVVITGSMDESDVAPEGTLTGVGVSGTGNTVTLDGAVNMTLDSTQENDVGTFSAVGITVSGSDNTVNINGGMNLSTSVVDNHYDELPFNQNTYGITVSGDNTVNVSGQSIINITGLYGEPSGLASLSGGGHLVLNPDSTLDINFNAASMWGGQVSATSVYAVMYASGNDTDISNYGIINASTGTTIAKVSDGASMRNSGKVNISSSGSSFSQTAAMEASAVGSSVVNAQGGEINITSADKPVGSSFYYVYFPAAWIANTEYALLATNYGSVENDAGATINLNGAGLYGVAAAKGTATNAGTINVDGFVPTLDEDGNITGKTFYSTSQLYTMSTGVITGSSEAGKGNATGLNTGTINVNNEGIGMLALNGGTVTNQGTINLTADDGVEKSADNQLIGMAVINGGTAINDESGTINILADYGQAFYNDGSGTIVNYGTICVGDDCQDAATYNPTDSAVSVVFADSSVMAEAGTTTTLTGNALINGNVSNEGTVTGQTIFISSADAVLTNQTGAIINSNLTMSAGQLNNDGTLSGQVSLSGNATVQNSGTLVSDSSSDGIYLTGNASLINTGTLEFTAAQSSKPLRYSGNAQVINAGTMNVTGVADGIVSDYGATDAFFWNQQGATLNFSGNNGWGVKMGGSGYSAQNDGTINISGNKSVAMYVAGSNQAVNNGTINLGTEGGSDSGLIGMQLASDATEDAVIENNGTINIYADNSYAFSKAGANGHVVNNGTVYIADDVTGSGLIAQDSATIEGLNGNDGNASEVHYYNHDNSNSLNGYVVGTNADGSAGQLMVSNASMNGVSVNTGFTSGTSATTMTFDNVVQGSNLTDADAITSTSVVWNAQGSTDAQGNVDVTMTKNAYADVATDSSVSSVANALDAGYTSNELYSSLNVGSTAELNSALKQVSGSQATNVFREARMLGNRFDMLADAAPQVSSGLAFNVVAKGDPRAELGKNTDYDMMALRQKLALTDSQNLTMEYGIARLDGSGSQSAGNNGITGGYSQFFGLKHQMAFDNGLSWNNALRYDVHNLDSNRSVSYGDTNKTADSSAKQQYLEFRSEGAKTFELSEALTVTPYAGVKLRHTLEDGYQERNAGDFNLNMNSGSETAVDSIVGMKLDYAGKDGWGASATLEGGPNLSYAKSQRSATLAGAGSQRFAVDDGQSGGGVNSLATVGVKYSGESSALQLDAFHWKEDGISDKGMMLNYKKMF